MKDVPVVPGEQRELPTPFDWHKLLPAEEWQLARPVIGAAGERNVAIAAGGGLAQAVYAQRARRTKDIDLFLLPRDRQTMVESLANAGFVDYYDQAPYDRSWIFRGIRDGLIIDLIWQMANHRAQVDHRWLERGPTVEIDGTLLRLMAVEELIWTKLYVLGRDRCDWPDLLNILYIQASQLDWPHLLDRLGEDAPLAASLLCVFGWICPLQAREIPARVWNCLGVARPCDDRACPIDWSRVRRLDSRDWFGPQLPSSAEE